MGPEYGTWVLVGVAVRVGDCCGVAVDVATGGAPPTVYCHTPPPMVATKTV